MKKSNSRVLWTVIGLIVVFGLAYWLGMRNDKTDWPDKSANQSDTISPTAQSDTQEAGTQTASPAAGKIAYFNKDYDFALSLPERWQDYRVNKDTDEWGDHYSFELWRNQGGRGSVFTISAYSKKDWEKISSGAIKPTYLAERSNTVFAYSLGQDDEGFVGFPDVEMGLQYKGPLFDAQEIILPSFELK